MRCLVLLCLSTVMCGAQDDALVIRMNRFAATYNVFAEKMNAGVFDRKAALELSRQWRAVEKSGEWPR